MICTRLLRPYEVKILWKVIVVNTSVANNTDKSRKVIYVDKNVRQLFGEHSVSKIVSLHG